jgi:hypothetical protein
VATDNDIYVPQTAGTLEFAIFLFKDQNGNWNNTYKFRPYWKGMVDRAPTLSAVYLQVFNRSILQWETIDSNDTTGSREEFELAGWIDENLTNYYNADFIVSCRVWQESA